MKAFKDSRISVTVDMPASKQELMEVVSVDTLKENYDAIVVGTDPEGLAAAISAARNGLSTLLIESRERDVLGGLMTVGWLNSIDMNWDRTVSTKLGSEPSYLNKGIFEEWYEQIEGHSFDVTSAANAFYKLVSTEENIDLYMEASAIEPLVHTENNGQVVEGIKVSHSDGTKQSISAPAVIDATQDADIASAAGAAFTIGREDLGDKSSQMAVTAVFRLKNIDDQVWKQVAKRLNGNNDPNTGVDKLSAWGYGKEMADYKSTNPERTKMRGLNIGRQLDETMLINALHIFEVDPLDPDSQKEGLEIAAREADNVVTFLRNFKEFKNIELDSIASELYVRESRHLQGLYRLNIIDLLENRDHWDRIAFGSYPADIQRTSPDDNGAVILNPLKYAVPFRSIVPQEVDGLLVIGRSASFDTLAHGSTRVIPTGMAAGQAAGAAIRVAVDEGVTFSELAESKESIEKLQNMLNEQGMELEEYSLEPQSYMKHKDYPGLRAAVYMGITFGSYNNEFNLDDISNPQRIVNKLYSIVKLYPEFFQGDPGKSLIAVLKPNEEDLSIEQASYAIAKTIGLEATFEKAKSLLIERGILNPNTLEGIKNLKRITDGEMYMLLKDAVESQTGIEFDAL
ncbi:hypothetical protein GCM10008968_21590 [Bacillus horti]